MERPTPLSSHPTFYQSGATQSHKISDDLEVITRGYQDVYIPFWLVSRYLPCPWEVREHYTSSIHHTPVSRASVTWHHLRRHDEGDPGDDDEEARGEVDLQQYIAVQYSTVSTVQYSKHSTVQYRWWDRPATAPGSASSPAQPGAIVDM